MPVVQGRGDSELITKLNRGPILEIIALDGGRECKRVRRCGYEETRLFRCEEEIHCADGVVMRISLSSGEYRGSSQVQYLESMVTLG